MKLSKLLAVTLLLASSQMASATMAPKLEDMDNQALYESIEQWLGNEIVTLSVNAHNDHYGDINEAKVLELDKQWREEQKQKMKPLIASTLSSPLSVYLTRMQGQSLGLFVEIFVMDNKGLNVGQSSITSDFWQGDEAKFQQTFDVGPEAIFVDEPEWDDKMKIWRVQVNKSLVDPKTKELIGAATVEVNLTELARRQSFTD